jgi:hypothetical protein
MVWPHLTMLIESFHAWCHEEGGGREIMCVRAIGKVLVDIKFVGHFPARNESYLRRPACVSVHSPVFGNTIYISPSCEPIAECITLSNSYIINSSS